MINICSARAEIISPAGLNSTKKGADDNDRA